jgi:hypothetical protein
LRDYDLVASRRLVLAAEVSRVPVILLRGGAQPRPSAAHTRWQIGSAASARAAHPLLARLPGPATITLDLLRQRGGPAGAAWGGAGGSNGITMMPVSSPGLSPSSPHAPSSVPSWLALWFPCLPCERMWTPQPPARRLRLAPSSPVWGRRCA